MMQNLAKQMGGVKVKRDECYHLAIQGHDGNVHKDGKGGYSVAIMKRGAWALKNALLKLPRAEVRQLGDTESVVHIVQPSRSEACAIRRIIRAKRTKIIKPAVLAAMRLRMASVRACKGHGIG